MLSLESVDGRRVNTCVSGSGSRSANVAAPSALPVGADPLFLGGSIGGGTLCLVGGDDGSGSGVGAGGADAASLATAHAEAGGSGSGGGAAWRGGGAEG